MTVHEVSERAGVSVRTLQYYDRLGLLRPAARTEAGYRLYDGTALERLGQILLLRELEFPLRDICAILDSPGFDRDRALERQIELLRLKKERLERIIAHAEAIKAKGEMTMDPGTFDKSRIEEYTRRAKEEWGGTDAYSEYERRSAGRSYGEQAALASDMMDIFARLGKLRGADPASDAAQALVCELRSFITAHWYDCTPGILSGLGKMYAAGGEFTENIDAAGGEGTALFASRAIEAYCARQ